MRKDYSSCHLSLCKKYTTDSSTKLVVREQSRLHGNYQMHNTMDISYLYYFHIRKISFPKRRNPLAISCLLKAQLNTRVTNILLPKAEQCKTSKYTKLKLSEVLRALHLLLLVILIRKFCSEICITL